MDSDHEIPERLRMNLLNRLSRAEGQIAAIRRMVARGDDCAKVCQQMSAARRALQRASAMMTVCHVQRSLVDCGSDVPEAEFESLVRDIARLV